MEVELENRGLSKRKRQILKAIVDAHIQDGGPVGSKYILQSQQLGCSAATIRNEMAELEEMGYLEQPHASAGRIPSELGYRFYVDSLIEHYVMTTNEIAQINHLLRSKMGELDQILTLPRRHPGNPSRLPERMLTHPDTNDSWETNFVSDGLK